MTSTAVEQCSVQQLVEALNRRKPSGPTSLNLIRKSLPKPIRQCDEALAEALQTGVVWKYGVVRGIDQYWTEAPEEYAWKLVEIDLRKRSVGLPKSEILKKLKHKIFAGVLDAHDWAESLISNGRLFQEIHRSGGKKHLMLMLGRYDFVDHLIDQTLFKLKTFAEQNHLSLEPLINRARSRLSLDCPPQQDKSSSADSPPAAVHSKPPIVFGHLLEPVSASVDVSPSDAEVREQILQAMRDINPRADEGSPVLMKELRERLDFQQIEKRRFDHILLDLYRAQQVLLFKTSSAQLASYEKHNFVSDADGNFYNAVTFWRK